MSINQLHRKYAKKDVEKAKNFVRFAIKNGRAIKGQVGCAVLRANDGYESSATARVTTLITHVQTAKIILITPEKMKLIRSESCTKFLEVFNLLRAKEDLNSSLL